MEFTSNKNKGLLWNTMMEGGIFTGLDNSNFQDIKQLFETTISDISLSTQRTQQMNQPLPSLVQLNKQFITKFPGILNQYKTSGPAAQNITEVYTNQQLSSQRIDDINLKVKQQQAERGNIVLKPKELDFTQQLDEKPISNMDEQLAQMMADRNIDMKNLPEDKEKAASWISNGNKTDNLSLTDKLTDTATNTATNTAVAQKKVTFSEPQPGSLDPQPSSLEPQPSSLEPQPSSLEPQPSSLEPQPSFLNSEPGVFDNAKLDPLPSITDSAKLDLILSSLNELKETGHQTREMVIALQKSLNN